MSCYLFTDGLIDQLGGTKRLSFGYKRFADVLIKINPLSFTEQSEKLLEAFHEYQGECDRQDDVTVVGFKLLAKIIANDRK
jgi:serine phosphatase RsbU (regulator of sigma subunit)